MNRKTASAIIIDPPPLQHVWEHILETSAVLISWRIH